MKTLIFPKNVVRVTQIYKGNTHPGIDFGGSRIREYDIISVAKGIVIQTGYGKGFGHFIKIHHGDLNMTSIYLHLKKINVKKGDGVHQGEIIGLEGSSGHSTGAHLHFSLYNGYYKSYKVDHVNPLDYLVLGDKQTFYVGPSGNEIELSEIKTELVDPEINGVEFYKAKLRDIRDFIDEALEYGM